MVDYEMSRRLLSWRKDAFFFPRDPVDSAEPPDMPPHLCNGDLTHLPQMLRMRLSATAV
jgi:hypothetical protein